MTGPRISRRGILRGAVGGAAALGLYAWGVEPHWTDVVRRELPVARLPDDWIGRTLVQVSDLHVGGVDADYLRRQLQFIGQERPDLVVVTGDFMTCRGTEQVDEVARVMEALPMPPRGCAAVLGNHDYSQAHRWTNIEAAGRLSDRLTQLGVQVLRNRRQDFAGLELIGVDDLSGPMFDLRAALDGRDRTKPSIVLLHNPDGLDWRDWDGYRGWILSGHTHGGQVKPPFMTPPILPIDNRRYAAGECDLGDGRRLYVNRGLGHLTRVRFNARPEITIFTLVRASEESRDGDA